MKRTIVINCQICKGTGLYIGLTERDGVATICPCCGGTGKQEITYNEFEGRKERTDVTRVFEGSFGYVHRGKDTITEDDEHLHFSKFGCSYEEWKNGIVPIPMEELYCPYIYHNHGLGNGPCSRCEDGVDEFGFISYCNFYSDKEKCWKEWKQLQESKQ